MGRLGELVGRRAVRRLSIVTDRFLIEAGVVEQVRAFLADARIEVDLFDDG